MGLNSTRDGLCGICPAGCWVRAHLVDERIVKVEALPGHSLGMICRRGIHSPEIIYDPNRLKTPLKRRGPRGTHEFESISWDDAFGIIVEKLQALKKTMGPESTAIYTGRGSFDMAMCDFFQPRDVAVSSASSVLFPFGSPNTLGVGALCYVSFAMIAPHVTMGEMLITMDMDIEQAEFIVIWGANPATDSPPLAHRQILQARQRGARIVAIDPYRNQTARETEADWVPVRPGTDGALALAMIQVLIEEELYDEEFVNNWTIGFDELSRMTQHYRPEVVESITSVPEETIRKLARDLAAARGACPVMYTGLEYSDSGVQAIRAVFVLWGLAGQLDVPGGLLFRMKENIFPQNRKGLLANPDVRKALGRDRFPVYSMYRGESHAIGLPDAVLNGDPYAIRALIILGGSICTSWPNPALWKKTLKALDFLVCIDRYHTADSAYADIVLPATTMYEITSYMRYGPLFKIREKMIEPVGEARSDFLILAELAEWLGYGHLYPQTEEDIVAKALDGTGFTVEEVRRQDGAVQIPPVMLQYKKWEKGQLRYDKKPGFNTPTGKFEISSTILEEHGYDPLPVYTEPGEGPLTRPDLARKYPLIFNSGTRTNYDFRSQHHGVKGLVENHPDPQVTINRKDAKKRGISNRDWVWVETTRGRVKFRAMVTDDIVEGAVDANMGGGGPLGPPSWQDCNVNELTDLKHCDPISGFPIFKTLLCEVTKIEGQHVDVVRSMQVDEETEPVTIGPIPKASTRRVYLDHNATTPIDPEVTEAMLPFLQKEWGNPSSIHSLGNQAHTQMEAARRKVAQALNCTARRVLFTSGGSEANNLVIQGVVHSHKGRCHLITSSVEHPAVLATFRAMEKMGSEITVLSVDKGGRVSPDDLRRAIQANTALVSIMYANNETGTIEPIQELACITHEHGILFHTDAVQALGKVPLDVDELGVDMLSVSAHKTYGPKGIGALYVRKGVELSPLIYGGGQEHGLRSGTENVAGIIGFGKASELAQRWLNQGDMRRVKNLRDRLEQGILSIVPKALSNSPPKSRLPNTLSMTLTGIRGESLVLMLDRLGVFFSSGSACKSGNPAPSGTLLAMGLTEEQAHCTIRLSLGVGNTEEDIDYSLECLREVLTDKGKAVRFSPCR